MVQGESLQTPPSTFGRVAKTQPSTLSGQRLSSNQSRSSSNKNLNSKAPFSSPITKRSNRPFSFLQEDENNNSGDFFTEATHNTFPTNPSYSSRQSSTPTSKNYQNSFESNFHPTTPLTPSRKSLAQRSKMPSSPRVQQEGFSGWNGESDDEEKVFNTNDRRKGERSSRNGENLPEYYVGGVVDPEREGGQGDTGAFKGCIVPFQEEVEVEDFDDDELMEKVLKGSSSDDEMSSTVLQATTLSIDFGSNTFNSIPDGLNLSGSRSSATKGSGRAGALSVKPTSKTPAHVASKHRRQPSALIKPTKSYPPNGDSPTSIPSYLLDPASSHSSRPATPPTPSSPNKYGKLLGAEGTPAQHQSSDDTPPPTPVFELMELSSQEVERKSSSQQTNCLGLDLGGANPVATSKDMDRVSNRSLNGSTSLDLQDRELMGPPIVPRSQSLTSRSTLKGIHSRSKSFTVDPVSVQSQPQIDGRSSISKRMPNINFSRLGQAMGMVPASASAAGSSVREELVGNSSSTVTSGGKSSGSQDGSERDSVDPMVSKISSKGSTVHHYASKTKRKSAIKSPTSPRIPKGARTRTRSQAPSNLSNPPSSSSSSSLSKVKTSKNQIISSLTASLSQPEAAFLSKTSHNAQPGLFNGTLQSSGFNPSASTSSKRSLGPTSKETLLGPAFDDGNKPTSSLSKSFEDGRIGLGMGFPPPSHPLKSLGKFSGISSYFNSVGSSGPEISGSKNLLNSRRRVNVSSLLPSALPSPAQPEDVQSGSLIEEEDEKEDKEVVKVPMTKHSRASLSLALKEGQKIQPARAKERVITTPKYTSSFAQTLLDIKNRELKSSPPTPALSESKGSPSEVPSIIITPPPAAILPSAARRLYASLHGISDGEERSSFASFKSVLLDSPNTVREKSSGLEGIGSAFLSLDEASKMDSPSIRGFSEDAFASPASLLNGGNSLESSPSSLGSFDTPVLGDESLESKIQSQIAQMPVAVLESRIDADTKGFNIAAIQIDSLLSDFLRMGSRQQKINLASRKLVTLLDDIIAGKSGAPNIPTLSRQKFEPLLPYDSAIGKGRRGGAGVGSEKIKYLLPKEWLQEEHEKMLEKILDHVATGIFALLQDERSPWEIPGMLSKLISFMKSSLSSPKDLEEDTVSEEEEVDRTLTEASPKEKKSKDLDASVLLMSLLHTHLSGYFERGEEARERNSSLNVPPQRKGNRKRWAALTAAKAAQDAAREKVLKMAVTGVISEEEYRRRERKKAAKGDLKDTFAHVNIVRFVGELHCLGLFPLGDLQAWLHRLFFDTVHPEVPSAFELEAGCALLITVGLNLETQADKDLSGLSSDAQEKNRTITASSSSPLSSRSLMDYSPATPPRLSSERAGLGIQASGSALVMNVRSQLVRSDSAPTSHWIHHNHSPSAARHSPLLTSRHDQWARTASAPSSPRNPSLSSVKDGSDSIMKSLSSSQSCRSSTPSLPIYSSEKPVEQSSPKTASQISTVPNPTHSEARHTLDSCTQRLSELLLHEDIIVDAKEWINELLALRQRNWRHRTSSS